MNILCNLPVECFEDRSRFAQRIVTFGPPDRMWVDGTFYPFDVGFDPSNGTLDQLLTQLPGGFVPDVILLYWPDQEPLPAGLENAPVPVVGVISDYNLSLTHVAGLWPFFDVLLVDTPGVGLFERLGFADVRAFCQYSFKAPSHRLYPEVERDLDVAFAGNLNPVVQRERAPWLERVARLRERGLRVEVRSGLFGADYGRFLARARIGFNRSIRGEMNLRGFEVPACGALLLMERENTELRDFLTPGEEVLVYGDDDLEAVVEDALADEPRRAAMARAGHERVQEHTMSRRFAALERCLSRRGPGRPASTPFDRALGRGLAMLSTWASGAASLRCLVEAAGLAPDDPRPLNAMAIALLREDMARHGRQALELLQKATAIAPTYVPAAVNLAVLLGAAGDAANATRWAELTEARLAAVRALGDLDGLVLPAGYSERGIAVAGALAEIARHGFAGHSIDAWRLTPAPASAV